MTSPLDPDILTHYEFAGERTRLMESTQGRLERERTQEILKASLPPAPATVLDVGGGAGVHAAWLAAAGYTVHLFDPIPLHVEQARETAARSPRPFEASLGDARALPVAAQSTDAVLLLGPLYHLDAEGRAQALGEAARVLRPGGILVGAAISRFASLLDGLRNRWLADETFSAIAAHDLATGEHRNPDPIGRQAWFTTAWFHRPEELRAEVEAAGLQLQRLYAVEGPLWLLGDLEERWAEPAERRQLMDAVRAVENEPSMLGVSAHLLVTARAPTPPLASSEREAKGLYRRIDRP